jgi:hypothetical protein
MAKNIFSDSCLLPPALEPFFGNRMAREIHDTLAQAFTGILVQATGANQVLMDGLEATQAHLEMGNCSSRGWTTGDRSLSGTST